MAITLTVDISNISDGTQIDAADVTVALNALKVHIENLLNGVQKFEAIRMVQIATPSPPAANEIKLYPKSDGALYSLDSAGTELNVLNFGVDIVQYQCFT